MTDNQYQSVLPDGVTPLMSIEPTLNIEKKPTDIITMSFVPEKKTVDMKLSILDNPFTKYNIIPDYTGKESMVSGALGFMGSRTDTQKKDIANDLGTDVVKGMGFNAGSVFDKKLEKYNKQNTQTGDIKKLSDGIENLNNSNSIFKNSSVALESKLGELGIAEIEKLNIEMANGVMTEKQYYMKYGEILNKYNAINEQNKLRDAQLDGIASRYAIVSGDDKQTLIDMIKNKGYEKMQQYVANKLGVPAKELDKKVTEVISGSITKAQQIEGFNIQEQRQGETRNKDVLVSAFSDVFRQAGDVLDEDDETVLRTKIFGNVIASDQNKQGLYNSVVGNLLKNSMVDIEGRTLGIATDRKEDGGLLRKRFNDILDSEEYKALLPVINEIISRPEVSADGSPNKGMIAAILNDVPEWKAYNNMLTIKKKEIENANIENDKTDFWNPLINLNQAKNNFDITWAKLGADEVNLQEKNKFTGKTYREEKIEGAIENYNEGMKNTQAINNTVGLDASKKRWFNNINEQNDAVMDAVINDPSRLLKTNDGIELASMPLRRGVEVTLDLLRGGLQFIGASMYTPYSSQKTEGSQEFMDNLIHADPMYMSNSYLLATEAGFKITDAVVGSPSDIALAITTFGLSKSLSAIKTLPAIQKALKGSKILGALEEATILNPNRITRDASQVTYNMLKSIAEPTNQGINVYFQSKFGVDPLWDYGIDAAIPMLGWTKDVLGGGSKLINTAFTLLSESQKLADSKGIAQFTVEDGKKVITEEFAAIVREGLKKNALNNNIVDSDLLQPGQIAAKNSMFYSELASGPDLVKYAMADAVSQMMLDGTDEGNKLVGKMESHIETNYPELAGQLGKGRDAEVISEVFKQEGTLVLDNLYKYRFIKNEINFAKDGNPILKNLDTMFNEVYAVGANIKDLKIKENWMDMASQAKMELVASIYGMFDKTATVGKSEYLAKFEKFAKLLEKGGSVPANSIGGIFKPVAIGNSIDAFKKIVNDSNGKMVKESIANWRNMSDTDKEGVFNAVAKYIDNGSKKEAEEFLTSIGLDKSYIGKILEAKNGGSTRAKVINSVMEKIGGKMKVGIKYVDAGEYTAGIRGIIANGGILTKQQAKQFELLSDIITQTASGDGYYVLSDASREIFNKISKYIDLNSVDKKNLMLHDILGTVMLDGAVESMKKGGKITEDVKTLVNNLSEGWGHRIFGSLKLEIKNLLIGKLDDITDIKSFLIEEGLQGYIDKEEILSALFSKNFNGIVFGKKGLITKTGKSMVDSLGSFFVVNKTEDVNSLVKKIVNNYIDASKTVSDYMSINGSEKSIAMSANIVGTTSENMEEALAIAENNADNIGINQVMNSGIDMFGSISISNVDGIVKMARDGKDKSEILRVVSNAFYSDTFQESKIADILKDNAKAYSEYRGAVELAKNRRALAGHLFNKFFSDGKLLAEIEYEGKKISLSSVLSNMEYSITKKGLITTAAHSIPKELITDDAQKFFSEGGMMDWLVNRFLEGKEDGLVALGKKLPDGITSYTQLTQAIHSRLLEIVKDPAIASDVLSRMIVGMPGYMDDIIRSENAISIDSLAYTLLDANRRDAVGGYKEMYSNFMDELKVAEGITKKQALSRQFMDRNIKNYQMVLMDSYIKEYIKDGVDISKRGFMSIMAKHAVDGSGLVASRFIQKNIDKFGIAKIAAENHVPMFSPFNVRTANDISGEFTAYLREYEDVFGKFEWYKGLIEKTDLRLDGIPEAIKKQEMNRLVNIYKKQKPSQQTLELFTDDVINAKAIQDTYNKNVVEQITDSMKYGRDGYDYYKGTVAVGSEYIDAALGNANDFNNGLKKILTDNSEKGLKALNETLDKMGAMDVFSNLAKIDGIDEAKKFLYDSEISKKLFNFSGEGYKSVVIDKAKGYRLEGEIMLYEDANYGKQWKIIELFNRGFTSVQNIIKNDTEQQGILFKALRSKKSVVKLADTKALAGVVEELFPGRDNVSAMYLQTFIREWKTKVIDIIKSQDRDTAINFNGASIKNILIQIETLGSKKDVTEFITKNDNGGLNRYMYAYWEAINKARTSMGLSDLYRRGEGEPTEAFTKLLMGSFDSRKLGDRQAAADVLEGLNGLWIGLDVHDYERVVSVIGGLLGKAGGYKRYLFNSFRNSNTSLTFWDNLAKTARKGEASLSAGMYAVMFNPLTSPTTMTQQLTQNWVHLNGKKMYELAMAGSDDIDEIVGLLDVVHPFDIIEGQKQVQLLSDVGDYGKRKSMDINHAMMGVSGQGIADKAMKSAVMKNSVASALCEFGYTPDAVKNVMETYGRVHMMLDSGMGKYISIENILTKNPEQIGHIISNKMIAEGIPQEDVIVKINELLGYKKELGNFGKVLDSAYMKAGSFYQFSNIPEIAGSLASSNKYSFLYMKFMNWSSKKAAEYTTDFAMAIAQKDNKKLLSIITSMVVEAGYVGRAYSMAERITGEDSGVDPMKIALSAYTPFIVMDMTLGNALSTIHQAATGEYKMPSSFAGTITPLSQYLINKGLMSTAYWARFAATPFMTKEEQEKFLRNDDGYFSATFAKLIFDSTKNFLFDRANRFGITKQINGINTLDPTITAGDILVNGILGAKVTNSIDNTNNMVNEMNDIMYGDNDSGFTVKLFMLGKDENIITENIHKFKSENGLYDYVQGVNIGERLDQYNDLVGVKSTANKAEFASLYADSEKYLSDNELATDIKNEAFDYIVKGSLLKYDPKSSGLDAIAENGKKVDKETIAQFTNDVISYMGSAKSAGLISKKINDIKISEDISKWKSKVGDKVFYGTLLAAQAKTMYDLTLEKYEAEYMKEKGINRKTLNAQNYSVTNAIKEKAKIEVAQKLTQLISDNWNTIVALDSRIPIEMAQKHFTVLSYNQGLIYNKDNVVIGSKYDSDITNKAYGLADKQRMIVDQNITRGMGFIESNTVFASTIANTINSVAKMPLDKKEKAMPRLMNMLDNAIEKNENNKGAMYGIAMGIFDGVNKIPELADKYSTQIMGIADKISTSDPISDSVIFDELKSQYIKTGGGSKKSLSAAKLGKIAEKLNKFNTVVDEIKFKDTGSLSSNKTTYKVYGNSVVPTIEARKPSEMKILTFQYVQPPVTKAPKVELKTGGATIKTIKSKTFKPKAIKKITKSFKK